MKKKFVPALLFLTSISVLNSCQKEVTQTENAPQTAAMSSITSDNLQGDGGTQFGAGVQGNSTDERIAVYNKLGVQYVRAMVELKNFNNDGIATEQRLTQLGFKVVMNINWDNPYGRGGRHPAPFPTDMGEYRQQLVKLFNMYQPDIAVIENEPTTDQFHTGPIEDYITELRTAVDVCKQFNIKVADGAIHVPYIQQVMNGNAQDGKALEVKKLIDAYKTIDLDYINIHTYGPTGKDPDVYQPGLLKQVADYLRNQTGKDIMSNEWSVHDSSPMLVRNMVNEFRDADFKISMVRSGHSGNGAVPLNKGTNLLPNGVTYSDVIK